jgi:hypothetical protein
MESLSDFMEKIRLMDLQCRLAPDSFTGLGRMFCYIHELGWLNRLLLKLRIRWVFPAGQPRDGYLDVFTMYEGLRMVLHGGGTVSGDQLPNLRSGNNS